MVREEQQGFVSKTRRKQDMHALQELGAALVGLTPEQLAGLDLPEALADAIAQARRLRGHEAIRRQMQYIGRLMRQVDAAPIRARLNALKHQSAAETARHHLIEAWRERLLADDGALTELAAACPRADIQNLRTLIRNARREAALDKPPRSARALFRALRLCLAEAGETRSDAPADPDQPGSMDGR